MLEGELPRIPILGTSVNKPSFWHFSDKNSSGIHRRLLVMKREKTLHDEEVKDGGTCSGIAQGTRYSD